MPCKRFCQGYLRRLGVLGVLGVQKMNWGAGAVVGWWEALTRRVAELK